MRFFISLSIAVAALVIVNIGCSESPNSPAAITITGKWKNPNATITFNSDSTYAIVRSDSALDHGSYALLDSSLTINSFIGEIEHFRFYQQTNDSLTLLHLSGSNYMLLAAQQTYPFRRQN